MIYEPLFYSIFGTRLIGSDCVLYLTKYTFLEFVYIFDMVRATVKVVGVDQIKRRVFWNIIFCVKHDVY